MTDELDLPAEAGAPALKPHRVHVKGAIVVDRAKVQTYDQARAPKGAKAAGEDVIEARRVIKPLEDGSLEVVEIPETRVPWWLIDSPTTSYTGPDDCPDCGLGLWSRGADMVCARLAADVKIHGCHKGCIVACGVKTDG